MTHTVPSVVIFLINLDVLLSVGFSPLQYGVFFFLPTSSMIMRHRTTEAYLSTNLQNSSRLHHGLHHGLRHGPLPPHGCLPGLRVCSRCISSAQSSRISQVMTESPTAPSMMSPTDAVESLQLCVGAYITPNASHWLGIQRRAYISTTGYRHKDPIG